MSDKDTPLERIADALSLKSLPPVNDWHPRTTRDIDIRIARNGDWFYQDSLIERTRMVKLFSTVLRVDDDGCTYLVTPQERLRIRVDDAPFTAVLVERHGAPDANTLVFTTNVGDTVIADAQHPIEVEYTEPDGEPSPYVIVRERLRALINRPVFYQLAEWAEEHDGVIGVVSAGSFMPLSSSADAPSSDSSSSDSSAKNSGHD